MCVFSRSMHAHMCAHACLLEHVCLEMLLSNSCYWFTFLSSLFEGPGDTQGEREREREGKKAIQSSSKIPKVWKVEFVTRCSQRIHFIIHFVDIGKMKGRISLLSFHRVRIILALTASAALAATKKTSVVHRQHRPTSCLNRFDKQIWYRFCFISPVYRFWLFRFNKMELNTNRRWRRILRPSQNVHAKHWMLTDF